MYIGTGIADTAVESSESPIHRSLAKSADIEALITAARDRNPSIISARAAWKASIENVRIDSALPDPQFALTWFPAPIETRLGPQDWNAMLSQQIPFPKKLSAKGDITAIGVAVASLKTDKIYRDVVSRVKIAFYELTYIRKAREIAGQNLEILSQFQGIAESAYGQDRTIFADVVKAQAQAGQVRYDLMLLEDLEETQITALNGLLNRAPQARIGILSGGMAFPELPGLDLLFRTAEERQETIAMARQAIQKAERENDLAGYSSYPDFKLGVTWSGIGDPDVNSPPADAGDDAFGIQLGVTIPLWSGKNKGRMIKARSLVREKTAVKDEIINQTRTGIRILYYKTRNAFRQAELYEKDLLPQALRTLELSETWFREGEGSFADVLESQSAIYNFQLSLARAESDIGKNMAQLERLIGGSIPGLKEGSQ
ncbi:MAG: TolC family protein [Desulfobacter sp.]|nr:TolC family protein [Desulfobacter sp.]